MKIRIIPRYWFGEFFLVTLLCTGILTSLLLYGNLIRNEELLVQALSISSAHFLELFFLLLPYALSIALPFGFVVSVVLLIGRWSSHGELVAYRSLGGNIFDLSRVVLLFGILISMVSTYSSLEWSPINRSKFDLRKREILWTQTNSLIDEKGEIEFTFRAEQHSETSGQLGALTGKRVTKASLSAFETSGNNWRNLRIVLSGGPKEEVLVVMHARHAFVEKNKERGELILDLRNVDLEYGFLSGEADNGEAQFLSFERWREPIVFEISQKDKPKGVKRMGFTELLSTIKKNHDSRTRSEALFHLSKNLSFGTSPLFLGMVLVPLGIFAGKSESFLNLTLGLGVGLSFYLLGLLFSVLLENNGLGYMGWWFPNIVCFFAGMHLMIITNKTR